MEGSILEKPELRQKILEQLRGLSKEDRERFNKSLLAQLTNSPEWQESSVVAVTLSRFPEVDTGAVITAAWEEGKIVVIPFSGKYRALSFHEYIPQSQLVESKFGLLEPADRDQEIAKHAIDLIIVPGLAYAADGYRVGFGGGYYDRYLADYGGKTVSLLYPCQFVPEVDQLVEPFDIPVGKLFLPQE